MEDSRSYVQDFLKDTSGWNGRLTKIQNSTRLDSFWPGVCVSFSQETEGNHIAQLAEGSANCKQAARRNRGSTRYWLLTEITSRWLMTLVWNWKNKLFLLCCALREKTAEVNLRQLQIQLMPVRNSQIQKTLEHAGKWSENMWTTSPIKRYLEVFTVVRYTSQFPFKRQWRCQKIKHQRINNMKTEETTTMARQESKIQVRCHTSGEEGWKNSSLLEFEGLLSLEERGTCWTPPEMQAPTNRETGQRSQSKVLQRLRW